MTFQTDAEIAAATAARKRRTFRVACSNIPQVTPAELKTLDRDNLSGDDYNRVVATARTTAQRIDRILNGYKSIGPALGDPYSTLTGFEEEEAKEQAHFLHKLLVFLNKWS